jgi:hypothetical protein
VANKVYDYKAFIAVLINTRGYENYHADWKAYYVEYYVRLFNILKEFFNARFDFKDFFFESQDFEDKRITAITVFYETIGEYLDCFRSKTDVLAAPKGYSELRGTYRPNIDRLRTDLEKAYIDCLYQLFEFMYGKVELVVTSEMLKEKGFDDSIEPNRMDYVMEEYDKTKLWWMNDK